LLNHFERISEQTGISVNFKQNIQNSHFPPDTALTAFRVIQEGLTNVARHAKVGEVDVRLWVDSKKQILGILVEDDGPGFDVHSILTSNVTTGLPGMYERVALSNGGIDIDSVIGQGTSLTVELPLEPNTQTA